MSDSLEARMRELRSRISEEGQAIDAYKAMTAALLGVGVFLGLLALGGGYEIFAGNTRLWLGLGITLRMLYWITGGLAVMSLVLLALASWRERRRDRTREAQLDKLEMELADLLDRKDAPAKDAPAKSSRR